MKKGGSKSTDELRSEYRRSDFGKLVRGKYASRLAKGDPIFSLGKHPVECGLTDASDHHDRHLRGCKSRRKDLFPGLLS